MVRKLRWGVGPIALALVVLTANVAFAVVTWTAPNGTSATPGRLGPNYTWDNGDPVLANNADGSISAAYVSDYTNGVFACDGSGVYLSNFYTRSTDGGATWSKGFRLNGKYHADRVTLQSSGSNVVTFFMSQTKYWGCPGGSTFDTTKPRYIYVRVNTANGASGSWGAAAKLPGQTTNSRGDYLYSGSSGANVYLVTTNTATGKIWLWQSHNSGASFTGPTNVGATTAVDNSSGYVGGFSGLPAVAATGTNVVVSWVSNPSGAVQAAVSSNSGTSFGAPTQLAASGGNANNGYVQADGSGTRLAVTWTTTSGAFVDVYDTVGASWGSAHTIVAFPDGGGGIGTNNQGGEGAIVSLSGTTGISVTLSECNNTGSSICDNAALSEEKTREALVYYSSTNNGSTFPTRSVITVPGTKKGSFINDYGDMIVYNNKPFVLWNAHDAFYGAYTVQIRVGSSL
jgi:hypothetical protein